MTTAPKNADEPATPAETPKAAADDEKPGRKEKAEKGEKGDKPEKPTKGKEGKGKSGKTPAGAPGAAAKKSRRPVPDNPNFRYIVRVAGSDLDGLRPVALALTGVRGVGMRIAEATCQLAQVKPSEMIGNLPEATVEGIESVLNQLPTQLPAWMINRPVDRATGQSFHYLGAELETARRDDVNQMKMIRSYRGVRHERGQKVRGQRTRSNGRTGMAAGVLKKAAKEAAAAKSKEGGAAPAAPAAPAAAPAPPEKKA